jgi:hypothetical protein
MKTKLRLPKKAFIDPANYKVIDIETMTWDEWVKLLWDLRPYFAWRCFDRYPENLIHFSPNDCLSEHFEHRPCLCVVCQPDGSVKWEWHKPHAPDSLCRRKED